jgi:hypothetical protein
MRDFTNIDIEKNRIEFLDSRFYRHANGNFYPSVTTILDAYPKSAAFFEWLKKQGEDADEIRDEAGRKGSAVHQLCEDFDNGLECNMLSEYGKPAYKQIEWAMFERYVEFREKHPAYELLANEVHYISPVFGFAGTLDRVFDFKGKKILLDIKTSNSLHNHYWLQQAAYKELWDEVNPDTKIDEIRILWLNAKTRTEGTGKTTQGIGWQLKEPEYGIDHYWKLFNNVFQTWQEENRGMKPRNTVYNLTHKIETNGNEEINSTLSDLQEII